MSTFQQFRRGSRYFPDGLVRMDRAAIYLRNQLSELLAELEAKSTKTIGESAYRLSSVGREMTSLCRMAGESSLAQSARELIDIGERTPRETGIQILQSQISNLEEIEHLRRAEEEEAISEQRRMLEGRVGRSTENEAPLSVSDPKAVFVIMPFRQEFNDVWKGAIQKACGELGLTAIRVDMINRSSNITEDIVQSIENCHVAIADVTENNPNVMFELGYTVARAKPNIIISQSSDYLPFDIRHLRTIVYTNSWSGIEELRGKIVTFLKESLPRATSTTKPNRAKPIAKQAP